MERAYFESVTNKTNSMLMQDNMQFNAKKALNGSATGGGGAYNLTRTAIQAQ